MFSKRVNFLIGSGISYPAIPLMGTVDNEERLINDLEKKKIIQMPLTDRNEKLSALVVYVSKYLINQEKIKKYKDELINHKVKQISKKFYSYKLFLQVILDILYSSNSRQTPKSVNIFTTNYDLFLERAIDELLKKENFIFNDGARGYFDRVLDSSNFNRTVSYRGLSEKYIDEIPSLTLIKPHGSVNWKKEENANNILIKRNVEKSPYLVLPNGKEPRTTYEGDHFYSMLRMFQLELDKPNTLLIVIGFSFQDRHIAEMIRRATENPEIMIVCFGFNDADKRKFENNLKISSSNLVIITPSDLQSIKDFECKNTFNIDDLTRIIRGGVLDDDES